MPNQTYIAIDLGAESGRVMAGLWDGKTIRLEEVHRFPADDAIVLFGQIQNKSAHPVTFDAGPIAIGIGDRQYPSAFVDCASKVDPGTTIRFEVVGQGDVDGARAHLALRNTFRVLLPGLHESPTASPSPTPAHRLWLPRER